MQLSNLSLAYLLEENKEVLTGSIVRKVQQLKNGGLKLKLQTRQGTKDLVMTLDAFFIAKHTFPIEDKPSNFTQRAKKFVNNKKIISVHQQKFERIIFIELQDSYLVLEMFHNGNIILLDKDKKIIDALTRQEFSDRTIKPKQDYVLPPIRGFDPLQINEKELLETLKKSDKTIFQTLAANVNIAPEIAEEVFLLTKIQKETQAKNITAQEVKKIAEKIKEFYTISKEKFAPIKTKKTIFPFPLKSAKDQGESIQSINDFLDESFSVTAETELKQELVGHASTEKNKFEYMQKQQEEAKGRLSEVKGDSTEKAEKIYASYEEIQAILNIVNTLHNQKKPKEEIIEKLKEVIGDEWFKKILEIDLKKKEITLDL